MQIKFIDELPPVNKPCIYRADIINTLKEIVKFPPGRFAEVYTIDKNKDGSGVLIKNIVNLINFHQKVGKFHAVSRTIGNTRFVFAKYLG